jgi:uncharacterized protein (TIRG00374 family)
VASNLDRRFWLGLAVGGALATWFLYTVEWASTWRAFTGVKLGWVALATALLFAEPMVRAVRWRVLLAHVDPDVRLYDLWSASVIGAAMNTVLPLRGGDVIRPGVLARRRGLPFVTVASSTVVERLFDVFGLLTVVTCTVAAFPTSRALEALRWTVVVLVVVGTVTGLGVLMLASGRVRLGFSVLVPVAVRPRVMQLFDRVVAGLSVVRDPRRVMPALGLTLVLWFNGFLALLCLFEAFSLDLPLVAGLFTQSALGGAVAVPQAPGYWGPFQVVFSETMGFFGADSAYADASALLFWAVSFVPVTIVGLAEVARTGAGLMTIREEALEEAERIES